MPQCETTGFPGDGDGDGDDDDDDDDDDDGEHELTSGSVRGFSP